MYASKLQEEEAETTTITRIEQEQVWSFVIANITFDKIVVTLHTM